MKPTESIRPSGHPIRFLITSPTPPPSRLSLSPSSGVQHQRAGGYCNQTRALSNVKARGMRGIRLEMGHHSAPSSAQPLTTLPTHCTSESTAKPPPPTASASVPNPTQRVPQDFLEKRAPLDSALRSRRGARRVDESGVGRPHQPAIV